MLTFIKIFEILAAIFAVLCIPYIIWSVYLGETMFAILGVVEFIVDGMCGLYLHITRKSWEELEKDKEDKK